MTAQVDSFGAIATEYHESFLLNESARLARERIHCTFARHFGTTSGLVLDIGCGSGIDAQFLGRIGCRVYGIDRSSGMIEEAKRRLALSKTDLASRVSFEAIEVTETTLDTVLSSASPNHVILSFGVINFVSDLDGLFGAIGRSLSRGGICIASTLSMDSWWEHVRRGGSERTGFQPRLIPIHQTPTETWFWSSERVSAASRAHFDTIETYGIGLVHPPPYFDAYLRKFPLLQKALWNLDRRFESSRIATKFSDHVVVVLKRR